MRVAQSEPFTYAGHTVRLSTMLDGAGSPLWVAEVEGTEMMLVLGARDGEDPVQIVALVERWIDDGMPNGGPGA